MLPQLPAYGRCLAGLMLQKHMRRLHTPAALTVTVQSDLATMALRRSFLVVHHCQPAKQDSKHQMYNAHHHNIGTTLLLQLQMYCQTHVLDTFAFHSPACCSLGPCCHDCTQSIRQQLHWKGSAPSLNIKAQATGMAGQEASTKALSRWSSQLRLGQNMYLL